MSRNCSDNYSLARDIRIKYSGDGGVAMASICAMLNATPEEAAAILVKCALRQQRKYQTDEGR